MNAARPVIEEGILGAGDWVMWRDPDEFPHVEPGAHRVDDLIAAMAPAAGVAVARRRFGEGWNAEWPGRHVSPRFVPAERSRRLRPPRCRTPFRYGPMVVGPHLHRPPLRDGASNETFPPIGSGRLPIPGQACDARRPATRVTPQPGLCQGACGTPGAPGGRSSGGRSAGSCWPWPA